MTTHRYPDDVKPPFGLWTRAAVQQVLAERFDAHVSQRTPGRNPGHCGLTRRALLRRA
jgi:hypothetical protein